MEMIFWRIGNTLYPMFHFQQMQWNSKERTVFSCCCCCFSCCTSVSIICVICVICGQRIENLFTPRFVLLITISFITSSNASLMFTSHNVLIFEAFIRPNVFSFVEQLKRSSNICMHIYMQIYMQICYTEDFYYISDFSISPDIYCITNCNFIFNYKLGRECHHIFILF